MRRAVAREFTFAKTEFPAAARGGNCKRRQGAGAAKLSFPRTGSGDVRLNYVCIKVRPGMRGVLFTARPAWPFGIVLRAAICTRPVV